MKTIFLINFNGFSSRYLLYTDILKVFKKAGVRVVVLTPNADEPYFREEFEDDQVIIEQLEVDKCTAYRDGSALQRLFDRFRAYTTGGTDENISIRLEHQVYQKSVKKTNPKQMAIRLLVDVAVWFLSRSRLLRRLLVAFESRFFVGNFHRHLFEKYQPDLVVTTSLGYWHPDVYLMREAKANGALMVPIILSWDNTSTKGMAGANFDFVISWTEVMAKELIAFHDVDPQSIFVGGIAHFDLYYRPDSLMGRDKIFERMGLDPNRKLLILATKTPSNYPWNPDLVRLLAKATKDDSFASPCQVLVRLHPNHFRTEETGEFRHNALLEEYKTIEKENEFVHFNIPQIRSKLLSADMPYSEMVDVGSMLKHADVLVNIFSTMSLEACIFDLPVVNVGFEGDPGRVTRARHAIKFDETQFHNQRVIQTGGVPIAYDPEELTEKINHYLEDRSLYAAERTTIVKQECGPYPGEAGSQIANYLLHLIDSNKSPDLAESRSA
jgi:hypothetical protein